MLADTFNSVDRVSDIDDVTCRHVSEGGDAESEGQVPVAGHDVRQHGDGDVSTQSRQRCDALLRCRRESAHCDLG